jgi:hypothetical protein
MTTPRSAWTCAGRWRFARHHLEMLVAMLLGMAVLGPLESALLDPLGWRSVRAVPELDALVMATNTTAAMVAWMGYRGHSWAATGLMAAAVHLPVRRAGRAAVAGSSLADRDARRRPCADAAGDGRRDAAAPRGAHRLPPGGSVTTAPCDPSRHAAEEGLRPGTSSRSEALTSLPPGPNRSTGPMLMSSGPPRSRTGDRGFTAW